MRRARLEFWAIVRGLLLALLFAGVVANVLVGAVFHGGEVAKLIAWIVCLVGLGPLAIREARR